DAVAGGDDAADGVDNGAVERVGHGADHRGGRSAGQLRVGVESDDVLHPGKDGDVPGLDGERVEFSAEIFVEIEKLAPLALPTHPDALARIEDAMAVEQEERSAFGRGRIAEVEVVDEGDGEIDERVGVVFAGLGNGVRQIRKQREVEIGVRVGEESHLELVDQLVQLCFVQEQGGNGDQCGVVGGDSLAEVELRQSGGFEDGGDGVVDEVHSGLRGRQEKENEREGQAANDGMVGNKRH